MGGAGYIYYLDRPQRVLVPRGAEGRAGVGGLGDEEVGAAGVADRGDVLSLCAIFNIENDYLVTIHYCNLGTPG